MKPQTKERYAPVRVRGCQGLYRVSNFGNVKGKQLLKQQTKETGFNYVVLTKSNGFEQQCITVHKLVALSFLSNPKGFKWVIHKDGNPSNNNVSNLKWVSSEQRKRHLAKNGFFKKINNRGKLKNEDVKRIQSLYKQKEYTQKILAELYGVSQAAISKALKRKTAKI